MESWVSKKPLNLGEIHDVLLLDDKKKICIFSGLDKFLSFGLDANNVM